MGTRGLDSEEALVTDFHNYEKVVVESITTLRDRHAPRVHAVPVRPKTAAQAAVRRGSRRTSTRRSGWLSC